MKKFNKLVESILNEENQLIQSQFDGPSGTEISNLIITNSKRDPNKYAKDLINAFNNVDQYNASNALAKSHDLWVEFQNGEGIHINYNVDNFGEVFQWLIANKIDKTLAQNWSKEEKKVNKEISK